MTTDSPPRVGEMLISTAPEGAGIFDQSVVLLLDCDDSGVLGVIINKLSETELTEVLPQWEELVAPPPALFTGGPLSPNGAVCLAKLAKPHEEPPGWRRVRGEIGLLHLDTPVELAVGGYSDLRIFAGYAAWEPGQLEEELRQDLWVRGVARDEDVFGAEPTTLWRRMLRRQGGPSAVLSTWVSDPEQN